MIRFSFSLATLVFASTAFRTFAQDCHTSIPEARCPTLLDYEEIETLIFEWIEQSTCPDPADTDAANHWDWDTDEQDCNFFPRGRGPNPLGPRLIRHAFHDAAGISDGFVDLTNRANAGLESSDHVLTLLYKTSTFADGGLISEVLNMADFAAWSYIAALRFTALLQGRGNGVAIVPDIPITIGRQPFVDGSEQPTETLPADHSNGQNVEAYFAEVFKFSPEEAATIMGAHTLGGAGRAESGFRGPWTRPRYVFDNEYYRNIRAPRSTDESCPQQDPIIPDPTSQCNGWEVRGIRSAAGQKFQWSHSCDSEGSGCTQLMLHADMGLFKDIDEFICTTAHVGAGTNGCQEEGQVWGFPEDSICGEFTPESRIFALCFEDKPDTDRLKASVDEYADDLASFIEEFGVVFNRMITEHNPNALVTLSVSDDSSPPASPGDAAIGADCAVAVSGCVDDSSQNPTICNYCASEMCGKRQRGGDVAFTCVPLGWTPPPPRGEGGRGGGGRPARTRPPRPGRNLRSI